MYQIITDTSAELNPGMITCCEVKAAPFKISIEEHTFIDDENLDMDEFFRIMRETTTPIRTACPSPDEFLRLMDGDHIFMVTITGKLSGSYNAAQVAKQLYLEKHPEAKVHIFDSQSATAGETGVVVFLDQLIRAKKTFDEIVQATEELIRKSLTIFALCSFTNLARNGRVPKIAGKLSRILHVKCIARNNHGKILPISIERGVKRTLNSLVEKAYKLCDKTLTCPIIISEANDRTSAEYVREKLLEFFPERIVEITKMRGLSSTYAEEGGIVVFL